jgi:hypothetical protein
LLAFGDAPRRFLERLRDLHVVLERGKASPEPWEQSVEDFAEAVVQRFAVGSEKPELSQVLHTIPSIELGGCETAIGERRQCQGRRKRRNSAVRFRSGPAFYPIRAFSIFM